MVLDSDVARWLRNARTRFLASCRALTRLPVHTLALQTHLHIEDDATQHRSSLLHCLRSTVDGIATNDEAAFDASVNALLSNLEACCFPEGVALLIINRADQSLASLYAHDNDRLHVFEQHLDLILSNVRHVDDWNDAKTTTLLFNSLAQPRYCTLSFRQIDAHRVVVFAALAPLEALSNLRASIIGVATETLVMLFRQRMLLLEFRAKEEQWAEAERVHDLMAFAGSFGHGFNNHLAIISGYGEMIAGGQDANDALKMYANEILQAAGHAKSSVDQILAFPRIGKNIPRSFKLGETAEMLLPILYYSLPSTAKIQIDFFGDVSVVRGDKKELGAILTELGKIVSKAIQHNGTVLFSAASFQNDRQTSFRYGELEPGEYLRISVAGIRAASDDDLHGSGSRAMQEYEDGLGGIGEPFKFSRRHWMSPPRQMP